MPTVIGHHDVKDTEHWLASPKREEFFGPLGVTNIRTFVDPENPTRVAVLMDVSDMDAVMAAMETVSDPRSHKMRHVFAINDFIKCRPPRSLSRSRPTGLEPHY